MTERKIPGLTNGQRQETRQHAHRQSPHQWGMAVRACAALAMLMDVREMTSVWKKLEMGLLKGCAWADTLPARFLNACHA